MPKPVFESTFDLPDEGTYLGKIFETTFETDAKGLSARARVEIVEGIEHEEHNIGMKVMDNFPLYAKFGVSRLLGTLIKCGAKLDSSKEYPDDFFVAEKAQNNAIKQLLEREYGFTIKHNKIEGRDKPVANITIVMTKEEFKDKKKNYVPGKKADTKPAGTETPKAGTDVDEWT